MSAVRTMTNGYHADHPIDAHAYAEALAHATRWCPPTPPHGATDSLDRLVGRFQCAGGVGEDAGGYSVAEAGGVNRR